MSMDRVTFAHKLDLLVDQNPFSPSTVTAALNAAVTALGGDTTTYDTTLQRAPAGLIPGQRTNSKFTNELALLINRGKAGNLTVATMASLLTAARPTPPPTNTAAPVVSITAGTGVAGATTLGCSTGTWTGSPTLTRQWLRGGATIAGATGATYVTVASDAATNISCRVAGTNAGGTVEVTSNAIAIT
jgi:hypothetical protein